MAITQPYTNNYVKQVAELADINDHNGAILKIVEYVKKRDGELFEERLMPNRITAIIMEHKQKGYMTPYLLKQRNRIKDELFRKLNIVELKLFAGVL